MTLSTGNRLRHRARADWPGTTPPVAPVTVVRVHPKVWAAALALVDGDGSRLKVISPSRVEIRR